MVEKSFHTFVYTDLQKLFCELLATCFEIDPDLKYNVYLDT